MIVQNFLDLLVAISDSILISVIILGEQSLYWMIMYTKIHNNAIYVYEGLHLYFKPWQH